MISLKCKSCGDIIPVDSNQTTVICGSCGNRYEVPMDDKKEQFLNLYSRADDAWGHKDFEEASELYQQILNQDNTQSEAHFGLVLCKYGITYEIDPGTGKKMPNCNRINRDSILDDMHYQATIKYASPEAAKTYKERAQVIDRISRDFLKIVDKEPPCDVFISYKRTGEDGNITQDSKVARKLYYHLKEKGFKVFFAEETLKSVAGEKYEPYIFAALSSAPVMIVLGSKRDHFEATWVKNEWRRYLVLMSQGLKKTLIPVFYDMDPYHMPGELRSLMAMNATEITFHEDITEIIRKKVADAREGTESAEAPQGPSLKDKYAPKAKVDQLVDLTDCDRDFAINVLIQCYGDVKKAQSFIQEDPGYKKDLWYCAECNAANIHDKCHKCGLTKRESVQLSRAREQMREKEKRESAAYKYAKKQKTKKIITVTAIILAVLAVLAGLFFLFKYIANLPTEAITSVGAALGFITAIIVVILRRIFSGEGGCVFFIIIYIVAALIFIALMFGIRALFVRNVDDLYTPEILQTYAGTYSNGDAFITFTECSPEGNVTGTFSFIVDEQYGSYGLSGKIISKKSNGELKMSITATEWIVQPPDFTMLDPVDLTFSKNYTQIKSSRYSMNLAAGEDSATAERTLKSAEDLKKLSGSKDIFFLGSDIDLSGTDWQPIENFSGVLIGNGYTITGMTIQVDQSNVGFFSVLNGAVTDLNFSDATVEVTGRNENIGILCGKIESGNISNISVTGSVLASTGTNVGGVVGNLGLKDGFSLTNVKSDAVVTGQSCVGGIVGSVAAEADSGKTATLSKLNNTGTITAEDEYAGGIAGYLNLQASYSSEYTVQFSDLENTGAILGDTYVGGLLGYAETDAENSVMEGCTNNASVTGECYVGCIGGKMAYITINNCSNEGSTLTANGHLSDSGVKYAYVGGFAGYGYRANNCTNTVSINYTGTGNYVGGIFGYTDSCDEQTMASLTNSADISGYQYVGGIFGGISGETGSSNTINLSLFKNSGAITGQSAYTGGIIGYMHLTASYSSADTVMITDFENTGSIIGADYVGGIFGSAETDSLESVMQDCSNSSSVTGECYVGCIAGQALYLQLTDCSNTGSTLTATGSTVIDGEKHAFVGGFVGNGYLASNCTNEVEINYTGSGKYVGGIIGCINIENADDLTMTNLKNTANISGSSYTGGIFGNVYILGNSSCTVNLSEFVNEASVKGKTYVGGIAGYLTQEVPYSSTATLYATEFQNTGSVSGSSYTGGIFGYGYTDSEDSLISDSSTSGSFGNLDGIKKD